MSKPKLLCVDDEQPVLQGLKLHLSQKYEVHTADSGQEALKVFDEEGPFPVVLSDARMPGMDGIELLSHIRQKSPDTLRLLLTGQTDFDLVMNAINEGNVFKYLLKPIPPKKLHDELAEVFKLFNENAE